MRPPKIKQKLIMVGLKINIFNKIIYDALDRDDGLITENHYTK